MSRATTTFYATPDEAIRVAKNRAKSTYSTQYIYQDASGLSIRKTLVEAEQPVMKVLFDGTVHHLKPINEALNEQEIKNTVEQIVKLEQESDDLLDNDNFSEAAACTRTRQKLEEELEERGYFLGESGEDMIIYHADCLKNVKDAWLIFDRAEWKWRQPEEVI